MSIMFVKVRSLSRAQGHNAVAKSAYISRSRIHDARTGRTHDFRRVPGLVHSEIVLPRGVDVSDDAWQRDRNVLWNAAESSERMRNSRVGREYTLALPHELPPEARRDLALGFARHVAERYSVAVDVAIHGPTLKGDPRNHHVHLLASTREISASGFGRKASIEWSTSRRRENDLPHIVIEYRQLRQVWAARANERLLEAGIDAHLEPRSRRTIERELERTAEQPMRAAQNERAAEIRREPQAAQRAVDRWLAYREARGPHRDAAARAPSLEKARDLDFGLGL